MASSSYNALRTVQLATPMIEKIKNKIAPPENWRNYFSAIFSGKLKEPSIEEIRTAVDHWIEDYDNLDETPYLCHFLHLPKNKYIDQSNIDRLAIFDQPPNCSSTELINLRIPLIRLKKSDEIAIFLYDFEKFQQLLADKQDTTYGPIFVAKELIEEKFRLVKHRYEWSCAKNNLPNFIKKDIDYEVTYEDKHDRVRYATSGQKTKFNESVLFQENYFNQHWVGVFLFFVFGDRNFLKKTKVLKNVK